MRSTSILGGTSGRPNACDFWRWRELPIKKRPNQLLLQLTSYDGVSPDFEDTWVMLYGDDIETVAELVQNSDSVWLSVTGAAEVMSIYDSEIDESEPQAVWHALHVEEVAMPDEFIALLCEGAQRDAVEYRKRLAARQEVTV